MRKILKDEGGFTLTEVLVAMVLMILVMFALYSIFDMSIRVFSFGNDKLEATENARIGLAKMEREIRAAYPYNKLTNTNETLFPAFGPNPSSQITFGNDLNDNRIIDTATNEEITYEVNGTTLQRRGSPAVEFVGKFDNGCPDPAPSDTPGNQSDDTPGLCFTFLERDGSTLASSESEAAIVKIELKINKDGRTQVLSTDVALRNRVS
ncbi:hypothetical protein BH23ACT11_BH23ACT11_24380 [soil metagenome]